MVRPRRARVTGLSDSHVRIDVSGVRGGSENGKHVYACFAALNLLHPWKNHPFSVLSTPLLHPRTSIICSDSQSQSSSGPSEKLHRCRNAGQGQASCPSIAAPSSYYRLDALRAQINGITKYLRSHDNMLVLIEGPYPGNSTHDLLCCDQLLLISGDIGITGLLPFANNHWNVKLAWNVKESARCLLNDLVGAFSRSANKDIRVGSRLDVAPVLGEEVEAGCQRVGVAVTGPRSLFDDVRGAFAKAARSGRTEFELEVEAYS